MKNNLDDLTYLNLHPIIDNDIIEAIKDMDLEKCPLDVDYKRPACRCGPYIIYYGVEKNKLYDIHKKEWLW